MVPTMKLLPVLLFPFVALALSASPAPALRFEPGQPFPDLVLPSLDDGRPLSLAAFRGKKLLLHIFASW